MGQQACLTCSNSLDDLAIFQRRFFAVLLYFGRVAQCMVRFILMLMPCWRSKLSLISSDLCLNIAHEHAFLHLNFYGKDASAILSVRVPSSLGTNWRAMRSPDELTLW